MHDPLRRCTLHEIIVPGPASQLGSLKDLGALFVASLDVPRAPASRLRWNRSAPHRRSVSGVMGAGPLLTHSLECDTPINEPTVS